MKSLLTLFLGVALLLLGGAGGWAQEELIQGPTAEYRITVRKAIEAFNARNFQLALKQCDLLEAITPNSAVVLNMRAAVALEERRFDDATSLCRASLEIDPRFFPPRFNLAEIPFLQKKYAEARDGYEQLLAEGPGNELLQYRIFMTYLLEGNEAAAEDALKRVKYPGSTGAYYYAKAAWCIQHGQAEEGQGWVKSGDWVFSRAKNHYYAEVFYDLGWLKRPADSAETPSDLAVK